MADGNTRERILDAAEKLFAEQGISDTSLRSVTRAAGVNLAAIHYYFGSKEALLDAVVGRRAGPVNEERLRILGDLEARSDGAPLEVEDILGAFIPPAATVLSANAAEGHRLARLLPRIEAQPPEIVEALSREHFGQVALRFVDALG